MAKVPGKFKFALIPFDQHPFSHELSATEPGYLHDCFDLGTTLFPSRLQSIGLRNQEG